METKKLAKKIRISTLNMTCQGRSSHIGSIFSIADILAVLYGKILHVNPKKPKAKNRDRFILSKGHAGAAVYAVLAELRFFDKEKLKTHYQNGSDLSGHVSHRGIPGVDLSTGSLGHGLSIAAGMALGMKKDDNSHKVFVLLSDGECDEGSTWEAILFAAHHNLDNLIAIVDYNKIQSLGTVSETIELEPFVDKWKSFGWSTIEVNGHDHDQLLKELKKLPKELRKPTVIIAHTIKGKGVSFMENNLLWHYRCAKGEEFEAALEELTKDND
jgi:transketolase